MIYALRALRELSLTAPASCKVVINSDEEIGSPESTPLIRSLARRAERAFILEPAFGKSGKLKTARKAVGSFTMTIKGRASHAGVNPEEGVSAVLELSHQIQRLFALNDAERGITVNVGTIAGGTRSNVIAADVRASIDVRVRTLEDAKAVESAIRSLTPVNPNTTLHVDGGLDHPPMEPSERNQALWRLAQESGRRLGLELEDAAVGGASDGNTTSQYTATLDGLGAVGDGAHAAHEYVELFPLVERAALLVLLLLAPLSALTTAVTAQTGARQRSAIMIIVREATSADVLAITEIFQACYGTDYSDSRFYDPAALNKLVISDDTLMVVAQEQDTGKVLGTASVILEVGAYADLTGEFGRLVVLPGSQRGTVLPWRNAWGGEDACIGLIEGRAAHPYTLYRRRHSTRWFLP
jgi:hypothetical protein